MCSHDLTLPQVVCELCRVLRECLDFNFLAPRGLAAEKLSRNTTVREGNSLRTRFRFRRVSWLQFLNVFTKHRCATNFDFSHPVPVLAESNVGRESDRFGGVQEKHKNTVPGTYILLPGHYAQDSCGGAGKNLRAAESDSGRQRVRVRQGAPCDPTLINTPKTPAKPSEVHPLKPSSQTAEVEERVVDETAIAAPEMHSGDCQGSMPTWSRPSDPRLYR